MDVVKPLFRGYLFAIGKADQIRELDTWLRVNGVHVHCVQSHAGIVALPESEIAIIERLMAQGEIIQATEVVKTGDQVSIIRGPLFGLDGIVETYSKRNRRVVVCITVGEQVKRVSLEATFIDAGAARVLSTTSGRSARQPVPSI
ncbi:MAG: hypothetical protein Q7V14_03565 [Coriobacteriia bacterium]|nr:hypothetical protein [Coriobacteriia bacterium]